MMTFDHVCGDAIFNKTARFRGDNDHARRRARLLGAVPCLSRVRHDVLVRTSYAANFFSRIHPG